MYLYCLNIALRGNFLITNYRIADCRNIPFGRLKSVQLVYILAWQREMSVIIDIMPIEV